MVATDPRGFLPAAVRLDSYQRRTSFISHPPHRFVFLRQAPFHVRIRAGTAAAADFGPARIPSRVRRSRVCSASPRFPRTVRFAFRLVICDDRRGRASSTERISVQGSDVSTSPSFGGDGNAASASTPDHQPRVCSSAAATTNDASVTTLRTRAYRSRFPADFRVVGAESEVSPQSRHHRGESPISSSPVIKAWPSVPDLERGPGRVADSSSDEPEGDHGFADGWNAERERSLHLSPLP